ETISPTAHYTSYVWVAHGQSHDAFATPQGRAMYHALRGANVVARAIGGPSLEGMLLARHRLIDLELSRAIDAGLVGQVVEVVTEGLINYFDRATVIGMWGRFARALATFPHGVYLSDLIIEDGNRGPIVQGFSWLLSAFVRGKVHVHFASVRDAEDALAAAGL